LPRTKVRVGQKQFWVVRRERSEIWTERPH